jgi:hypothetical protein
MSLNLSGFTNNTEDLHKLNRHSGMLLAGIQTRAPRDFCVAGFWLKACRNDVHGPASREPAPNADCEVDANALETKERSSSVGARPQKPLIGR